MLLLWLLSFLAFPSANNSSSVKLISWHSYSLVCIEFRLAQLIFVRKSILSSFLCCHEPSSAQVRSQFSNERRTRRINTASIFVVQGYSRVQKTTSAHVTSRSSTCKTVQQQRYYFFASNLLTRERCSVCEVIRHVSLSGLFMFSNYCCR